MSISSWMGRVSYAVRTGFAAYNSRHLVVRPEWGSNDHAARIGRYGIFQSYYDSTTYDTIEAFSALLKADQSLYRWTRALYNPVHRENNLYKAYVYQGAVDTRTLKGGAMPLVFDNDSLEEPLQQVIKWSNLSQQLSMFVHHAALLGDAAWWVSSDTERKRVRLEVLHPSKIREVTVDSAGNVKKCLLEWEEADPTDYDTLIGRGSGIARQGKTYTRQTYADQEWFKTYRDGELDQEYPNLYGFVPLKIGYFEPTDDGWGRNSFYASRRKIDELNAQASIISDSVKRVVEPLLKAKGISQQRNADGTLKTTFTVERDSKSGVSLLMLSGDADVEPVVIPIDLAGASAHAKDLLSEIKADMPVLALPDIRDKGNLTAPGVEKGYGDAVGVINNVRQNLDPVVVAALQMAVTMGAVDGYDGFSAFDVDSYDSGEMDLAIAPREVIPDSLSKTDTLLALQQVSSLPPAFQRVFLRKMGGISEDDIEDLVSAAEEQQEQRARAEARGLADALFGSDDEDTDETQSQANPQAGPAATGSGVGEAGGVQPQPAG